MSRIICSSWTCYKSCGSTRAQLPAERRPRLILARFQALSFSLRSCLCKCWLSSRSLARKVPQARPVSCSELQSRGLSDSPRWRRRLLSKIMDQKDQNVYLLRGCIWVFAAIMRNATRYNSPRFKWIYLIELRTNRTDEYRKSVIAKIVALRLKASAMNNARVILKFIGHYWIREECVNFLPKLIDRAHFHLTIFDIFFSSSFHAAGFLKWLIRAIYV